MIGVVVLMIQMANKLLDEYAFPFLLFSLPSPSNTYINKTWSEVSGIDLDEINRMEREFLLRPALNNFYAKISGKNAPNRCVRINNAVVNFNLLKGLVSAKEGNYCQRF